MMNRRLLLFPVVLLATACVDNDFEGIDEITKLRTLAIALEPGELGPGEVGTLSALSVTPDPDAVITYTWEICLFDDGPDQKYRCSTDPETGETAGLVLPGDASTTTLPYDVVTDAVGSIDEVCATFDSFDLPDFIEPPDCDRGLPLRVRLTAASGDEEEVAVREILLLREGEAQRDDRNTNPQISGVVLSQRTKEGEVLVEDVVLAADAVTPVSLDVDVSVDLQAIVDAPGAAQEYEPFGEDGERLEAREERLLMSWYATRGVMDRNTTYYAEELASPTELQSNEWRPSKQTEARVGDVVSIWVVLRDTRGGVSFIERRIRIEARGGS